MATKAPKQAMEYPAYEQDAYGWAIHQARLLRAGQLSDIDIDNIAEEIETMGRSERRSLSSNLMQILIHLLKWTYQPERRSRSWMVSIIKHRDGYRHDLEENPSLKPEVPAILVRAYDDARRLAAAESGLPIKTFPEACPYDWPTILEVDFSI
jgi:hypothetical protein